ncbi:hypothetical protein IKG49_00855 [Candidatus Saccharibacteria bacterium]|nr:hypothetical protein [Candidatus Saccharibacteria bacterium]
MNKRYIDFVPTHKVVSSEKKSTNTGGVYAAVPESGARRRVNTSSGAASSRERASSVERRYVASEMEFGVKKQSGVDGGMDYGMGKHSSVDGEVEYRTKRRSARDDEVEFGVIQDLGSDYGGALEKRPLNSRVVQEKVLTKTPVRNSDKAVTKETKVKKRTFKIPSNPFINQEKVVKRPLSGNAYQKEPVAPKEEKKGPVTIITKPKKDSRVSLVVTIIITIILGAVAGTVAFLLLPK